ncbi:uncharacterized protein Dvar_79200 [Desulfosarcina variabilis str. Montpellier]|uniref:EF-hand domain-containing protein n=1 Tax=Desulfosarcina variabilis TaxID=2300 RepID=UPI003AFB38FB
MVINSIGSAFSNTGQMAGMGRRPSPAEMFDKIDEDDDGSLNEAEAQGIADMISDATGEDMAVEDLMAAYDEDGDGVLSEEETLAALEANRPEGPLPSPETDHGDLATRSWSQTGSIENYMMMANLDKDQSPSSVLEMLGGESIASSGPRFSVNTMV